MRLPIGLVLAGSSWLLSAQTLPPNANGVAMGHLHFVVKDLEVQRRFWTMMGAIPTVKGGGFKIPGVILLMRQADPKLGEPLGGTEGSIIDHIGFKVQDLNHYLAAAQDAGYPILTSATQTAQSHKANILGPDQIKIELIEDTKLTVPIAMHHVHFYNSPVDATRAWYVDHFGAVAGKRDQFEAADLPGVNLTFSPANQQLRPTKGRSLDHVGFEVKNLEKFLKKLESNGWKADSPYRRIPQLGIAVAFFTDPWGTQLELTEGLNTW